MSLLGKEWYGEFIAHKDGFKEGVEEGFKTGYETAKKEFADRKTGKWIHTGVIGNPISMGRCSECLEIVSWDSETGVSFEDYKFCPYCGAKMEVDE